MKLAPINGRIVIKRLEAEEKTSGGVYLPDTARKGSTEGKVVAVAEDATEEVAVGDRVVYKEFSGTEITVDGEEYVLVSEEDLLVKYLSVDEIPD